MRGHGEQPAAAAVCEKNYSKVLGAENDAILILVPGGWAVVGKGGWLCRLSVRTVLRHESFCQTTTSDWPHQRQFLYQLDLAHTHTRKLGVKTQANLAFF